MSCFRAWSFFFRGKLIDFFPGSDRSACSTVEVSQLIGSFHKSDNRLASLNIDPLSLFFRGRLIDLLLQILDYSDYFQRSVDRAFVEDGVVLFS